MSNVAVMHFPHTLVRKPFQHVERLMMVLFFGSILVHFITVFTLTKVVHIAGQMKLNEQEVERFAKVMQNPLQQKIKEQVKPKEQIKTDKEEMAAKAEEEEAAKEEVAAKKPKEAKEEVKTASEVEARAEARKAERAASAGDRRARASAAADAALGGGGAGGGGLLGMITAGGKGGRGGGGGSAMAGVDFGKSMSFGADLSKVGRVTTDAGAAGGGRGVRGEVATGMSIPSAAASKVAGKAAGGLESRKVAVKVSGPSSVPDAVKAVEGRDAAAVNALVNQNKGEISYCYEKALAENPGLKGRVVVQFTVRTNGRVTSVEIVSSSVKNEDLERCITQNVRRWRFGGVADSVGDATYQYPFAFAPQ